MKAKGIKTKANFQIYNFILLSDSKAIISAAFLFIMVKCLALTKIQNIPLFANLY